MRKQHSGGVDFGLLLVRLAVGAYIVVAGLKKLGLFVVEQSPLKAYFCWPGFEAIKKNLTTFTTESFNPLRPDWLPINAGTVYAYMIPFAEVIFGALIILGVFTRSFSTLLLLMVASFTYALVKGDFVNLLTGPAINTNFIILAVLILLIFAGAGRVSIDRLLGRKKAELDEEQEPPERF